MKSFEDKLDAIREDITEIKVTMATNTSSLKEHIRRTELLEADVRPIKRHVAMIEGALKVVGLVALLAGMAASISKLV